MRYLTIILLICSNTFMTIAWYGHLKFKHPNLMLTILISWAIAFIEYCLAVPANRIGINYFSLPQLKIIQEVITLSIFAIFSFVLFKQKFTINYLYAMFCLLGAVYFIFRA